MLTLRPVPFAEAIEAARQRGVALLEEFYGALQGAARAKAFTVSGLGSIAQISQVLDSLTAALESGESLGDWKKRMREGAIALPLSRRAP